MLGTLPVKNLLFFFQDFLQLVADTKKEIYPISEHNLKKSGYLFFFGAILFPNKSTQKNFKKTMVIVGYAHGPLVLNCFILKPSLFFIFGLTYIWYTINLIVGVNQLYQYKNLIKSTFLVTAPIIILFVYTILQISTLLTGTTT